MKATGIVRRIDDLGRIVIPKEIRKNLRMNIGDPVEIFTDNEGGVVLKKYSYLNELSSFASNYADAIYQTIGYPVIVTDRDNVVAVCGIAKKDLIDQKISSDLDKILYDKKTHHSSEGTSMIRPIDRSDKQAVCCAPVISNGDVYGCVIVLKGDKNSNIDKTDVKLVEMAAAFLSKQID